MKYSTLKLYRYERRLLGCMHTVNNLVGERRRPWNDNDAMHNWKKVLVDRKSEDFCAHTNLLYIISIYKHKKKV